MLNRKALKQMARESLRSVRPRPALIALVVLLLTYVLNVVLSFLIIDPVQVITTVVDAMEAGVGEMEAAVAATAQLGRGGIMVLFLQILLALFSTVLGFGFVSYCLRCAKGQVANFSTLIEGFGMVGRVLLLGVFLVGYYLFWGLVCSIPAGIFASFVPSLGGFIFPAALIAIVYLMLRYAMAPFLLADHPELSARDALRGSRSLMCNRQGELFSLVLSFVGWLVLEVVIVCVVTYGAAFGFAFWILGKYQLRDTAISSLQIMPEFFSGIFLVIVAMFVALIPLLLFLLPYFGTTMAHYYRRLSAATVPPEGVVPPNL